MWRPGSGNRVSRASSYGVGVRPFPRDPAYRGRGWHAREESNAEDSAPVSQNPP
jgi:hypothetical protein